MNELDRERLAAQVERDQVLSELRDDPVAQETLGHVMEGLSKGIDRNQYMAIHCSPRMGEFIFTAIEMMLSQILETNQEKEEGRNQ
jgi:hypothetical protein